MQSATNLIFMHKYVVLIHTIHMDVVIFNDVIKTNWTVYILYHCGVSVKKSKTKCKL